MNLLRTGLFTAVLCTGGWAHAAAPLPDNPRLEPVREQLADAIATAERQSLPADALISKVREGLAKNVPAAAIVSAVRTLAQNLVKADQLVRAGGRTDASASLLRTLAEAESAGVEMSLASRLVQSNATDATVVRAIDTLTELAQRGYPRRPAAELVNQVLIADPGAIGRVAAGLDELRGAAGMSRIDAVDSVSRSLTTRSTLDGALGLSMEDPGTGNAPDRTRRGKGASDQGGAAVGKRMRHPRH